MRVKISQKFIDAGKPQNSQKCPLALACRDAFPNAVGVHVGPSWVSWETRSNTFVVHTYDHDAEDWIDKFDAGADVDPTTVNLIHI